MFRIYPRVRLQSVAKNFRECVIDVLNRNVFFRTPLKISIIYYPLSIIYYLKPFIDQIFRRGGSRADRKTQQFQPHKKIRANVFATLSNV